MGSEVDSGVSCKQAYDLLFSYLEGELPAETRQPLEAHLERCPPCRQFLVSYRTTAGLCREALERECPPEVTEAVQEFLRKKRERG